MNTRQKRLQEVYEHVRKFGKVHTQTDFASAIHYSRTYISAAVNGEEKYLTDRLFKNICEAYPDVFSLDYLLTGKGELLLSPYKKAVPDTQGMVSEDNPPAPASLPLWADTLIGIMSKQIAENEALHSELCKSINDVNELKKQLSELLCQLKK